MTLGKPSMRPLYSKRRWHNGSQSCLGSSSNTVPMSQYASLTWWIASVSPGAPELYWGKECHTDGTITIVHLDTLVSAWALEMQWGTYRIKILYLNYSRAWTKTTLQTQILTVGRVSVKGSAQLGERMRYLVVFTLEGSLVLLGLVDAGVLEQLDSLIKVREETTVAIQLCFTEGKHHQPVSCFSVLLITILMSKSFILRVILSWMCSFHLLFNLIII